MSLILDFNLWRGLLGITRDILQDRIDPRANLFNLAFEFSIIGFAHAHLPMAGLGAAFHGAPKAGANQPICDFP
ncbi:MAG: hypothetical protein PVI39_01445 [Desulfobacteraceae bacterium]|jgi:hypothetical protein